MANNPAESQYETIRFSWPGHTDEQKRADLIELKAIFDEPIAGVGADLRINARSLYFEIERSFDMDPDF